MRGRKLPLLMGGSIVSRMEICESSGLPIRMVSLVPRLSATRNKHAWSAWCIFSRDQNRAKVFRIERQRFAHVIQPAVRSTLGLYDIRPPIIIYM